MLKVPEVATSGLGQQEYENVAGNDTDFTTPYPSNPKLSENRSKRKTYVNYYGEIRAKNSKICSGEWPKNMLQTLKNGLLDFRSKNYGFCKKARSLTSKRNTTPSWKWHIMNISNMYLVISTNVKLINFCKGIRARGGVMNVHVV